MFTHASGSTTPKLSRLTNICFQGSPISRGPPSQQIRSYAELPSINGLSVHDWHDPWGRQMKSQLNSNISNLELWDCAVGVEHLADFLRHLRLQSLTYDSGLGDVQDGCLDLSPLNEALQVAWKPTLQSLTYYARGQELSYAGSVSVFPILREVCGEWQVLIPEGRLEDDRAIASEQRFFALPTSLQRLEIMDMRVSYAFSIMVWLYEQERFEWSGAWPK